MASSSVFYRFASRKDESRVTFDGTGVSVFDLKREIIIANNMTKANDFDLLIFDSASGQEYVDDSQIIPRSSSVIVKRVPLHRTGKGKTALYLAGAAGSTNSDKNPSFASNPTWSRSTMSKRFDGKDESGKPTTDGSATAASDSEAAAMAAMFKAQTAVWEETQEKMSHAQRVYTNTRGTGFARGAKTTTFQPHIADKPLPASYVCYRCGQKGHWIKDCPTNNDREYDNRPRIKRTTGIPRSMLKAVETPDHLTQGIMVTPEGGYVVAQPDAASWQKQLSRPKGLTAAEIRERVPNDPSLICPIDNKLLRDAVKTPCCGTAFCEECIQSHLLERDFTCPSCSKKVASLDKLAPDKPTRLKVLEYIERAVEDSKNEEVTNLANMSNMSNTAGADELLGPFNLEQDFYSDGQPGADMGIQQMLGDRIPQLQAQINQISVMLQNSSLPNQVRQTTEMQHQQLQIELQQAQTMSAALAAAATFQQQQQQLQQAQVNAVNAMMQQGWSNNPFPNQQPAGQDSAYQRLPVNNRRRNVKRERPSDFLEVGGGEGDGKIARYWE